MDLFEKTGKSVRSFCVHTEHNMITISLPTTGFSFYSTWLNICHSFPFQPLQNDHTMLSSLSLSLSRYIYITSSSPLSLEASTSSSLFPSPIMTTTPVFSAKWLIKSSGKLITVIVFLILDFLDNFFCIVFRILDECFEGKASPCYCEKKGEQVGDDELQLSETLYGRKNVFREMGFLGFARIWENSKKRGGVVGREVVVNRWSDCGCESCVSWMKNGDHQKLHVVVREPSKGNLRIPPFVNFPLIN